MKNPDKSDDLFLHHRGHRENQGKDWTEYPSVPSVLSVVCLFPHRPSDIVSTNSCTKGQISGSRLVATPSRFRLGFDGHVRTTELAESTVDAVFRTDNGGLFRLVQINDAFGAEGHADSASFAPLHIDGSLAFRFHIRCRRRIPRTRFKGQKLQPNRSSSGGLVKPGVSGFLGVLPLPNRLRSRFGERSMVLSEGIPVHVRRESTPSGGCVHPRCSGRFRAQ